MSDYQGLVTKWQKVQDEMPEYDTDLLLWSEAWGHIYVGYWRHSEEWIGRHRPESGESLPDTNPTHWTYFPAPPVAEVIARNVQPSPEPDFVKSLTELCVKHSFSLEIAPVWGKDGALSGELICRISPETAYEINEAKVTEMFPNGGKNDVV